MSSDWSVQQQVDRFRHDFHGLVGNIERVIHGKRAVIKSALVCMVARGHLLIEDVPGVAKTSLAKAIASSIRGARIQRIQFTPDLMPSDIVGVDVFHRDTHEFRFQPGPIFANVLLGDEINRGTPKTQAALLEAMAERQVTVGGTTRRIDGPFLCIATQNPSEHHGTFPLPESQLDRFMMRIKVGYPSQAEEAKVVVTARSGMRPEGLPSVVDLATLESMMSTVDRIHLDDKVVEYIVDSVSLTRDDAGKERGIGLGVSPRGCVALAAAAQANAATEGREYATIDDVKAVAVSVLSHRLMLTRSHGLGSGDRTAQAEDVIRTIFGSVAVPGL